MSERKPSANKNIKKLRAISMVCGLTRSWQQWVSENEDKQSSEPSGWAPGDPKDSGKIRSSQKSIPSRDLTDKNQDDLESRIKTGPVLKTVTRDVQERSVGIDFLTKRICKDPVSDELDKMLSRKGSPTRRRKCSNMVSELTRGWKEMEEEKKPDQESGEDCEDTGVQMGVSQEETGNNRTNESTAVTIKRSSVLGLVLLF